MKPVSAWEADDGTLHKTQEDALERERHELFKNLWFQLTADAGTVCSTALRAAMDAVWECRADIAQVLQAVEEHTGGSDD